MSSDYKCPGPCGRSIHHFCGKRIGGLSDEPQHGDSILCRDCDDAGFLKLGKEASCDDEDDDEDAEINDVDDEEEEEEAQKQDQCPIQAVNGNGMSSLVDYI